MRSIRIESNRDERCAFRVAEEPEVLCHSMPPRRCHRRSPRLQEAWLSSLVPREGLSLRGVTRHAGAASGRCRAGGERFFRTPTRRSRGDERERDIESGSSALRGLHDRRCSASPSPSPPRSPSRANNAAYRLHNERGTSAVSECCRSQRPRRLCTYELFSYSPLSGAAIMSTQIMRGDWRSIYIYIPKVPPPPPPRPLRPSGRMDGG